MLVMRFRETWRFAPLLIPMVVMVHFAVPGALGAVKYAFSPPGGVIAEQSSDKIVTGSGRLADIGPSLALFREKPVLGYGYGTLQTSGPDANARILDNQWLSSLLNVGLVGVLALVWLFTRFIRDVGRRARQERTVDGWLLVALVASVAAFGVGMFTYDAFAFTQVTFVFFVILALGSALVLARDPLFAPSFEPAPGRRMPVPVRRRWATCIVCGLMGLPLALGERSLRATAVMRHGVTRRAFPSQELPPGAVGSAFSLSTELGIADALVVSEPPLPAPSGGTLGVQAGAHLRGHPRSHIGADSYG